MQFVSMTITICEINHSLVLCLETRRFGDWITCLQVELIRWALKTETELNLRNVVILNKKKGRWIMAEIVIFVLISHRQQTIDIILS
jgi:hypothetical protein